MRKIYLFCFLFLASILTFNSEIVRLAGLSVWFNSPGSVRAEIAGKDGSLTVTQPNTVVNLYARLAVNAVAGSSSIGVEYPGGQFGLTPEAMSPGDVLLLIQMDGATIDTSDSPNYGRVLNLNNAGRYEFVTVNKVQGNVLTVNPPCGGLVFDYTANGKVQVIRVPQYTTLTINSGASITAPPWDGRTGGIVAFHSDKNVVIDGTIDVSGKGFRGGALSGTGGAVGRSDFTTTQQNDGAEKGEGIAGYQVNYDLAGGRFGRGAAANAGGGGTSHNSGGGGGANGGSLSAWTGQGVMDGTAVGADAWKKDPAFIAAGNQLANSTGGGRGGYSFADSNADALTNGPGDEAWGGDRRRNVGGWGGRPVEQDPTGRIFFGGGGGAGGQNDNSGGAGGNAGGLIFIIAEAVSGSGRLVSNGSDGQDTRNQNRDGAGGGGAGGTIVVSAKSLSGLSAQANGGKGGSQNVPLVPNGLESDGPGGGGGGGYIAYTGGSMATEVTGGVNGVSKSPSVTEFPVNGATRGASGLVVSSFGKIPFCKTTTDLVVTKSNDQDFIIPGVPTTYTISISNGGPNDTFGIDVIDQLPPAFLASSKSWTCTASAGSSCPASGTGDLVTKIDLLDKGSVTFKLTATVAPGATGSVTNTIRAVPPAGAVDADLANNVASDTDQLRPVADLQVSITNNRSTLVPGTDVIYTVTVRNPGPSDAPIFGLLAKIPSSVSITGIICNSTGGGCGTYSAATSDPGTIAYGGARLPAGAGNSIELTITGRIRPGERGTAVATAEAQIPAGAVYSDPVLANNQSSDSDPLTPVADLAITLSDGRLLAIPGESVTYQLTVKNNGPSDATGFNIATTIAPALTVTGVTCTVSGGDCGVRGSGAGQPLFSEVRLRAESGNLITIEITAIVSAGATGTLSSIAEIVIPSGAGFTDPGPGPNFASDSDQLTPTADLSIRKSSGASSLVPGGNVTYTVDVSSKGPSDAVGFGVIDQLPAAVSLISVTCVATNGNCGNNISRGNLVEFSGASLRPGQNSLLRYTILGRIDPAATGRLRNTAVLNIPTGGSMGGSSPSSSGGFVDPNPGGNSSDDDVPLTPQSNLVITKTNNQTKVVPGSPLSYRIEVINLGPSDAVGFSLVDTVPQIFNISSIACSGSGGTCGTNNSVGNQIAYTGAILRTGEGRSLVLTINGSVSPEATGSISNTASVVVPPGTDLVNTNQNASSASDSDQLSPLTDLSITKVPASATAIAGTSISYRIEVVNNGPSTATGANVVDTVPAGLQGVTWTCQAAAGSSCATPSGTGSLSSSVTLQPGGRTTFQVTGTISPSFTGNLQNTASVTPGPGSDDPVNGNNTASAPINVTTSADVSIVKTSSSSSIRAGDTVTFTTTVTNRGPSFARDVQITEQLPAGVDVRSVTASTGTCSGTTTITCNFGQLGVNAGSNTATVTVVIRTPFTFPPGPLSGTATVNSTTPDPSAANNSSTAVVQVGAPPAAKFTTIGVTVSNPSLCVGADKILNYSVTITNTGDGPQFDNPGAELVISHPIQMSSIYASCTASSGSCRTSSNVIEWNGELQPGQSLTLEYQTRVRSTTPTGVQFCTNFKAFYDTNSDRVNDAVTSVDNCLTSNCTSGAPCTGPNCSNVGPGVVLENIGEPVGNNQLPGSILIFPYYSSSSVLGYLHNTRISITNTDPAAPAFLHLFFIDGSNCTVADNFLCLTPNQTTSFLMSDLDPDVNGYLMAVAVNEDGCPIRQNTLIGEQLLRLPTGYGASVAAESVQALVDPTCQPTSTTATLNLDGTQYGRLARTLALDSIASDASGNSTMVVIDAIGGNLASSTDPIGPVFGLLFNDAEQGFSFTTTEGCQMVRTLGLSFPRSTPRFPTIVPAGRTGWLKLWTQNNSSPAIVGLSLTKNNNPQDFRGGHNLHKLTLTSTSISIPLIKPTCQ